MLSKYKILSNLLLVAALTILIAAAILRAAALVPMYLTYLTVLAAIIIIADAVFVRRNSKTAAWIGVVLGIAAIIASTNPSHIAALERFGSARALTAADITMVLGFYIFPAAYFILFFLWRWNAEQ